jgi:hypothetical protein
MSAPLLDRLNTVRRLHAKMRTTNNDAARRPLRDAMPALHDPTVELALTMLDVAKDLYRFTEVRA